MKKWKNNTLIVLLFLGSGLSIVGFGVSKMSPKQPREVIVPMKKEFARQEISPPREITESTLNSFKFCPMCGHQISTTE